MEILYFGWVRQRVGLAKEAVEPPGEVTDVRALVEWLRGRGGGYEAGLGNVAAASRGGEPGARDARRAGPPGRRGRAVPADDGRLRR